MKTDSQLKKDVIAELEWDPSVQAQRVGVAVSNGVVQLSGVLDTFAQKQAVERAVQRVAGVKALAVDLAVKLEPHHQRSDAEIASQIETAFKWHSQIPDERLQARVENGWVTLTGEVDWHHQRHNAQTVASSTTGVRGVSNNIQLRKRDASQYVAQRIRDALERYADDEYKKIEVQVNGDTVTLRGTVSSIEERTAVQNAAWFAPGISRVTNELKIQI
jgi:osmotically-inducible protein OsmY